MKNLDQLKDLIDRLDEDTTFSLGMGLRLRRTNLKRIRSTLITAGLEHATEDVDEELDLLLGKGDEVGLLKLFGVDDETIERRKEQEEQDPLQKDIDPERDYRTHALSNTKVGELVSAVAADNPAAAAVRILNALEEGEQEREGGARANVLDTIRKARSPLVKRIDDKREGKDG